MEQLETGSSYQRIQLKGFLLVGLYVAQVTTDHANGFDETYTVCSFVSEIIAKICESFSPH